MQNPAAAVRPSSLWWTLVPLWIAGTTVGWAFGFLPAMRSIASTSYAGADVRTDIVADALVGVGVLLLVILVIASSGAITGVSQQVALRTCIGAQHLNRWFVKTLFGTTIGWLLGWIGGLCTFVFNPPNTVETWLLRGLILGIVVGLSTGIAQGDLLATISPHTGWWVLISTVSWTAASIVYWLVYHLSGGPFEATTIYYEGGLWPKGYEAPGAWPAMFLGWLAGGLVLGTVTGIAMKLIVGTAESLRVE